MRTATDLINYNNKVMISVIITPSACDFSDKKCMAKAFWSVYEDIC